MWYYILLYYVSITLPFINYEKKVLFYVYMGNQEKKIKSSLLHCGKRGILYQFHIIYITLKYYFEGKVDLTYSDFSFMIGTNFVTNYLFSLKKKIYIIFYYTVLLSPHYVFLLCAKL